MLETPGLLKDSVRRKGTTRMWLQEMAEVAMWKGNWTGRRKARVLSNGTRRYKNMCGLRTTDQQLRLPLRRHARFSSPR